MKKVLHINEEVEKLLVSLCDSAFKSCGVNIFSTVKHLLESIETSPEQTEEK